MKDNEINDLTYDFDIGDLNDTYMQSNRRDKYYSDIVRGIVVGSRISQFLKIVFFIVICLAFVFICVCGMLILINLSKKPNVSFSDIGIAITGFGSVLSTVIVLPTIIAKHLFPENSEKDRFAFIRENQKMDQSYYYGFSDKSENDFLDNTEDD